MREPRSLEGARPPLFDRLVESNEAASNSVLDVDGVRQSVARELSLLLNTRSLSPLESTEPLMANVLSYGIPDFSHLNAASETDRSQFSLILLSKVQQFEPRLQQVRIKLTPQVNDPRSLVGSLEAVLRVRSISEPVSFPLVIDHKSGNVRVE